MEKLKKRSEIAPQDTWDLEALYATDEVWEADRKKAEELLDCLSKTGRHFGTESCAP